MFIRVFLFLPPGGRHDPGYERVVLLIRNPADALLAEFNRRNAGKVGQVALETFENAGKAGLYSNVSVGVGSFNVAPLPVNTIS